MGYDILDDSRVTNKVTTTTTTVVTKPGPKYSDYKWPYMDSYVPGVKMLEKDA